MATANATPLQTSSKPSAKSSDRVDCADDRGGPSPSWVRAEPSTPLSAPRCQRESTEFGADGGVIRVRQQSGEATAGSITGGHPIWPGDQWLRWSVAACLRTPPSLHIRTAGPKTHRDAAPAHWPLGRSVRSVARGPAVGSLEIRYWRRQCPNTAVNRDMSQGLSRGDSSSNSTQRHRLPTLADWMALSAPTPRTSSSDNHSLDV
jgi:hypothetical protein